MGTIPPINYSCLLPEPNKSCILNINKGSSAIAERPSCRVGQLWAKVEDDILQTI